MHLWLGHVLYSQQLGDYGSTSPLAVASEHIVNTMLGLVGHIDADLPFYIPFVLGYR